MLNKHNSFIIGLTGGIGSGKSTITTWFRLKGVPVWDADAAVHTIYHEPLDPAFKAIIQRWPSVLKENSIDRSALRDIIISDETANAYLKQTLQDSLSSSRNTFMAEHRACSIVVWDVPLLIESGMNQSVDLVMVIDVAPDIQRARIQTRNVWTENEITHMLSKQLLNDQRIQFADVIVDNNGSLSELYNQLEQWWANFNLETTLGL